MKFNPVGSIFEEKDVVLKVVEIKDPSTCKGCWYAGRTDGKSNYGSSCYTHRHACTSGNRKDKKQVIFQKVDLLPSPNMIKTKKQ